MKQLNAKQFLFAALFLFFGASDPPVYAQNISVGSDESLVASKIHKTNQMEIRAGNLAKQKGTTAKIRRFGDRLVRDHKLADSKIEDIAKHNALTIAPPQELITPEEEAKMQELEQSSGAVFDQTFLMMMKQGHDNAISMLSEAEQRLPANSDLQNMIDKIIPILRQHDQLAKNLQPGS